MRKGEQRDQEKKRLRTDAPISKVFPFNKVVKGRDDACKRDFCIVVHPSNRFRPPKLWFMIRDESDWVGF